MPSTKRRNKSSLPVPSSSDATNKKDSKSKKSSSSLVPRLLLTLLALVLSVGTAIIVSWYFSSSLNQPLNLPPVITNEMKNTKEYRERLWGSYRSNVYFGMRPRLPSSIVAGFAWVYAVATPTGETSLEVRHMCEHGDHLDRYGWTKHDGRSFGYQEIIDSYVQFSTDFITRSEQGHSWTAKIKAESRSPQDSAPISLLFYLFNEREESLSYSLAQDGSLRQITGRANEIGDFKMEFSSNSEKAGFGHLASDLNKLSLFSEFVKMLIKKQQKILLSGKEHMFENKVNRLVVYQIVGKLPIEIEIRFSSDSQVALGGVEFAKELTNRMKAFDDKFEFVFKLKEKNFTESHINFAKSAFSNLIGSISYFHGKSKVKSPKMKAPISYFPAALYTGVPSRSFFPRGFLWDEGFHQLLVTQWDTSITKDVLGHWMDLLNVDGWIPREQILGEEALSKVPEEFVVQLSSNGNPPTFFLTVEALLNKMRSNNNIDINFLQRLYPRLKVWFNWFQTTQKGPKPSSYQWKGRNQTISTELNPKTLTSGLDDYPRASHPSVDEYHVDLRCWLYFATQVLVRVADIIGVSSKDEQLLMKELSDFNKLNKLHWDSKRMMYSDYGLHTSNVKLVVNRDVNPPIKVRKVIKEPKLKFVNSFGYVNLFPFLVKLLPVDSVQLNDTLNHIANKSLLWTKYGLRSLSKTDPFYNKANTGQDKPYWRGAIWININYMCLGALHYYSNTEGPYRSLASDLYSKLRSNIIDNMYRQYQTTGFIWEQYDDRNGSGKGTHPFTGWSSLVVLIMAEIY